MKTSTFPTKADLIECQARIKPYIHRTPVLTSSQLNRLVGAELFFKCENFQRTGSFKMRGASNAVFRLSDQQRQVGVVAHSSGNFAQAVAMAARSADSNAWIVMPENAPRVKVEAVKGYGAEVVFCESTIEARERTAGEIAKQYQATFLHPSNDIDVIVGQGTAAMELFEDEPQLDALITPVGGGGLLAGCSLAARYFCESCKVYAGEPLAADDAWRSLQSGKIELNETADTIADGLRTNLGDNNFPIIQQCVEEIVRVTDDEIIAAMKLVWERMKIVCEPSCAVPLAAILKQSDLFAGRRVGVVLTGGNVDLQKLPF